MSKKKVTIKNKKSGQILASTSDPNKVQKFEGNLYFDPNVVNKDVLKITTKTYTCSYKGTCNWVDLDTPDYKAANVAWVYESPKPGYENIKGKYGFYAGNRESTVEESWPLPWSAYFLISYAQILSTKRTGYCAIYG